MGPNAHRCRSISDVLSFSTVSVVSFDPIRVRALCVEEPQLGRISSDRTRSVTLMTTTPLWSGPYVWNEATNSSVNYFRNFSRVYIRSIHERKLHSQNRDTEILRSRRHKPI